MSTERLARWSLGIPSGVFYAVPLRIPTILNDNRVQLVGCSQGMPENWIGRIAGYTCHRNGIEYRSSAFYRP
jgi:hypothetical protein